MTPSESQPGRRKTQKRSDDTRLAEAILHSGVNGVSAPELPTSKARILVADDHAFIRAALIRLINQQKDMACCGEADSIASTPLAVAQHKPQLILLDVRFNDGEAFELIRWLRLQFPAVAILVLSQCEEGVCAERVLQAGAKGYLMKQHAIEELLKALRIVLQGGV